MDKIILNQQDIQKDLLYYTKGDYSHLGCGIVFVLIFAIQFLGSLIEVVVSFSAGEIKNAMIFIGLSLFALLLVFLFANPSILKKAIKRRKNILNNNIHICKDICYKKEKMVIKSNAGEDMPSNYYTWYFKNTNSFISRDDSHQHLFDSTCNGTEFWLVFADGDKKPIQFYPTKNYEIVL